MFTIYDSFTGRIKRQSLSNDARHGEGALEGNFSASTHYVKRGEAVELPPKMANEPHFDYLLERWVDVVGVDPRSVLEHRNKLLSQSDWTQLADVPLETKAQWVAYRQALRDITTQPGYPIDVVWPEKPESTKPLFAPIIVQQPQAKEL
jgi:hypothetical protein